MRRPPRTADARAALWTWRALRAARAQLRAGAVRDVRLPAPPAVDPRAARAVRGVLSREAPTCLERALVLQRWLAAHGVEREVVVGTSGTGSAFAAHAWLDGESLPPGRSFVELIRLSP
jgi:hypothetical protein